MLDRRALLQLGLGFALASIGVDSSADGAFDDFDVDDWTLAGSARLARRALVVTPKRLVPSERMSALVLLHGLAETASERSGTHAWVERYGLLGAYRRLKNPPIVPTEGRGDLLPDRAREINKELGRRPYRGNTVFVCPFTPNVYRLARPQEALEELAGWIQEVLVPEVRSRTPVGGGPIGLDGCSLGGRIGLEIFVRRPALFATWGGVQTAIGKQSAPRWAERLARANTIAPAPRPLHVETSLGDPFHDANVALARALERRGVAHELCVFPGPHDQPWLREVGTLAMLMWQDQALSDT